jgi:hypothetical protein
MAPLWFRDRHSRVFAILAVLPPAWLSTVYD